MISAGAFLSKPHFENYTIRCFSKCGEEHRRVMDMVPLHYQDVFSATVFFLASCANILTNIMFKGILHQKIFYCLNFIFWIVMGCGIARFGRRGLKTTET